MKVVHFISSIDKTSGGPARSVTHLIKNITDLSKGFLIDLITAKTLEPIINNFIKNESNIYFFNLSIAGKLKLREHCFDETFLFHGHGLWQLPVHQMAKIARKLKKPYIITPRGMLEPWSLSQGKLKKQLALKLFQFNDLKKAVCIHATAPMEVESIRNLGFKNPIAMIPNGVNIDEFPTSFPEKSNKPKKILFLSRIHVKKGIENLIEAWKLIDKDLKKDWKIEIVGNGDENYIQSLKDLIISESMNEQIEIKKPVFGVEKITLFREASLFVLPTFSENFGIVIAEALASYTPVITTKGTPWEDLETYKCGWWIDIGIQPLKIALEEAIAINDKTLTEMVANGRKLVEDKYSMESVGKQMIQLYNWILTKENKPNFVYIL